MLYNTCTLLKYLIYYFIYRAIGYIPGVVFYPIFTWLFIILTTMFWAAVALYPTNNYQLMIQIN